MKTLDPDNNNNSTGKWTMEEDAKLAEAVTKFDNEWVGVAFLVPGRNNVQCRTRWAEGLDPKVYRGRWTEEEDAKLAEAVTKFGEVWVAQTQY
jgi:myb proto-oncogene protein